MCATVISFHTIMWSDSLFGLVFVGYYIRLKCYNSLDGFVWHSCEKNDLVHMAAILEL